jgi:hypothetical protein
MTDFFSGYDAWRLGDSLDEDVFCPECQQAVDAPGRRREEHRPWCPQSDAYEAEVEGDEDA